MALDDVGLKSDIEEILDGTVPLPDVEAAGVAWGDVFEDYASTGRIENPPLTFIPPVITGASVTALKSALEAAFSTLPGVPATVAGAITAALTAFWTATTFSASPGVATGGPALTTALTAIFLDVGGTHDSKAAAIRDAIAEYTKLVSVTYSGPVPPAGTFFVE